MKMKCFDIIFFYVEASFSWYFMKYIVFYPHYYVEYFEIVVKCNIYSLTL